MFGTREQYDIKTNDGLLSYMKACSSELTADVNRSETVLSSRSTETKIVQYAKHHLQNFKRAKASQLCSAFEIGRALGLLKEKFVTPGSRKDASEFHNHVLQHLQLSKSWVNKLMSLHDTYKDYPAIAKLSISIGTMLSPRMKTRMLEFIETDDFKTFYNSLQK